MAKTKTIQAWLAKDADGRMFLHTEKPEWRSVVGYGECFVSDNSVFVGRVLDNKLLKKGECKAVTITIA